MRWQPALILTCLAAVACGGEETNKTDQLAEACFMDQMGTREDCACMANEAEARLDPEVFDMFVTMGTLSPGDNGEATRRAKETAANMTPEQQQQMLDFMNAAISDCGMKP